jgi:outer membrane protein assembly factor BamD
MNVSRLTRLLAMVFLLLTIGGCGLLPEQIDETGDWSANKFYSEAKKALAGGDYERSIELYEKMQARYPFGRYAQQAQMEIVYAYYKYDEPESALAAADRFIKLYPRHPNVDYVYYLKGLVNFNKGKDIIAKYLPQDPTERDPGAARDAFNDFATLVRGYPQSKYAKDARQRMLFLRNNLAMYEVHVADYYMRRRAYVAAANRAKYVVEHYQRTPAVPRALAIMVGAYENLGLEELATDARRVMELNYPDEPAYAIERGGG